MNRRTSTAASGCKTNRDTGSRSTAGDGRNLRRVVGSSLFSLAAAAAACSSVDPASDVQDSLGESSEAALGEFLWDEPDYTCSQPIKDVVTEAYARGRIGARSSAVAECLSRVTEEQLERYMSGSFNGPYLHCATDAVPEGHVGTYAAYLATMAITPKPVRFLCCHDTSPCAPDQPNTTLSGEDEFGFGSVWAGGMPDIEGMKLYRLGNNPDKTASMFWHELSHNHINHGHPGATECGYGESEYSSGDNGGPSVMGSCVNEVLRESSASPVCAAMLCPDNSQAIVKRYGQFGPADPCECVPDAFNWPANENEQSDEFGHAVAVGDFDGDLDDDLAVGIPGENSHRGAVMVFRGTRTGPQFWQRIDQSEMRYDNFNVSPQELNRALGNTSDDQFGTALAAGDVNGDGIADLAIGIPGKNLHAGVVVVLHGSADGLNASRVELVDQRSHGGGIEADDRFGEALAIGLVDSDSTPDLVVGAPDETHNSIVKAGAVQAYKGAPTRLNVLSGIITGTSKQEFGKSLAVGTVGPSSARRIVIGAPARNTDVGAAFVYQRTSSAWSQTALLAPSTGKRFGASVAIGDIVGSSDGDVAVGSPYENTKGGAAYVFTGNSSGVSTTGTRITHDQEANDRFGWTVAIGDAISPYTTKRDLVVGVPTEGGGGAAVVYNGTIGSALGAPTAVLNQSTLWGIPPDSEGNVDPLVPLEINDGAFYGSAFAIGRFAGFSRDPFVAIGASRDVNSMRVGGLPTGAVFVYAPPNLNDSRKLDQMTMRYGDAPIFNP